MELLEGDGSVPTGWPVEQEGLTFLGSPVIHDVDGDGVPVMNLVGDKETLRSLACPLRARMFSIGPYRTRVSIATHAKTARIT